MINLLILLLFIILAIMFLIKYNNLDLVRLGGDYVGELKTEQIYPIKYNSYDLRCVPKVNDENNLLKKNLYNNNPVYEFVGNNKGLQ
jgi:hypothetical protein